MPLRFYIFYIFFTLSFLLYPGDLFYFSVFADIKDETRLFKQQEEILIHPIPVVNQFAQQPEISANGVYVVDLQSFTPVYEKNAFTQYLPASTTKVMTALVARDLYEVEDVVTVTRVMREGQQMGLVQNEQITVESLLYGSLVQSGNDAATALADFYGYDQFIDKMNEKADSLGMKNTNFVNPSGLDDFNQVTTAKDLALAAREVLNDPLLQKIVSTKSITVSDINFQYFHSLNNINQLLGEIPGLGGLKTGFTENAGENLISYYRQPEGKAFVIVILNSLDRFQDTRTMVDWINTNVEYIDPPSVL